MSRGSSRGPGMTRRPSCSNIVSVSIWNQCSAAFPPTIRLISRPEKRILRPVVPAKDSWVTLHASRPGSASDGRVAIVIERASAARSATVRLEAFGATAREREVATLLARGLSRAAIAESLVLSPHTVEDHTKSLYDKVGIASRQELVAQVFLDEYLPEVAQSTPLTSRGRFDRV
jgi:DNA-binding CsgD family transcriptional regulator